VSATEKNPTNAVAVKMLQDLECSFLKEAIEKSQGTIQKARAAFYGYMMERGFPTHELRQTSVTTSDGKTLDMPLARAIAATEYTLSKDGETAWAILTTGIFGSMSALVDKEGGKPAAEADLLATTEKQMTTAFIGLNTILRLRGNGYTFEEIQKMSSMEIRELLPLRNVKGELYSDQQAALHGVAIREAMKLPDIQALVSGDRLALQLGLEKKYWNSKDVGDTWLEWIGDATSMYNLFMLLPGAKAGEVGRSFVFWGSKELKAIEALEKSGQVITGTEAIANTIGLTQFLGAAGATDTGKAILGYLKQIGRYEESLKWYDKVIWTTGKLTGMLTINFTTVIATEKLFGHKAAMLMQAALMFGSDPETLVKLLDSQNIPRKKIAELIINDYLPATQVHLKRLAQIEKTSKELELLFERIKTKRLDSNDIAFLDKYFKDDWRRLIPNGQASHDSTIALGAAGEGARNGQDNGAGKAVSEKLKEARQAEMVETTKSAEQAQQVVNQLEGASPPVRGPPPPVRPPSMPRNIQRVLLETRRGVTKASYPGRAKYPMPPVAQEMSESAAAEALLMSGQYKKAEDKFEEIIKRLLAGDPALKQVDELPLEWLHLKRCLCYELQDPKLIKKIPKGPSGLTTALSEVEGAILNSPHLWEKPVDVTAGAFGNIYGVKGHPELLVKEVPAKLPQFNLDGTPKIDPATGKQLVKEISVMDDVQNTVVHNELARALEFEVPAMEVKLVYDGQGQLEKAVYVMRKVKGKPLKDLSAAEIFLYKEELSRHRALSVLINDYDRHIGNYLVTEEGHLVPIDAGVGDVMGYRSLKEGVADPLIMEGAWGRDHYYSRHFKDEICAVDAKGIPLEERAPEIDLFDPDEAFSRKGLVAEEALTYRDSLPTVKAIDKLVNDEEAFRKLIKTTYEKTFATEDVIQQRVQNIKRIKEAGNHPVDLNQIRADVLIDIAEEIKEMVEATVSTAVSREQRLNAVMKGLDKRHVIPRRTSEVRSPGANRNKRIALLPVFSNSHLLKAA
jgi:tetratricopeptide (TPR) repeat protein